MRQFRSILLTGGAGFIGSALARQLLNNEELRRLVVLDKLTYAGSRGNLIGPDQDPRFLFVEGDIGDRELVARLLREHDVCGVFNLAAESHVDRSIQNPDDFILTNVTGTANLLEVCRAAGVPMLQCSTDEVYGVAVPPAKFTDRSPLNPTSPYSASKAAADLLCLAARKTYGQDVVITRSSNNYGLRQHAEKLIPTLVAAALNDQPLPIYGDGMHIRDWIHVDDHCRGLVAAYSQGAAGSVYLFGGRCERTNLGVARNILEILGKPESLISFVKDRPGHDARYAVDNTKSLAHFGWRPQHRFRAVFPSVVRGLAANLTAAKT